MRAFDLVELLASHRKGNQLYTEFLRVPEMSVGIYVLPAEGTDPQHPHTEDELYYVASGRGSIVVEGERQPVTAGSLVFVPANVEHRFMDIEEELVVLVFFAPAEYSHQRAQH